MKEKKIDYNKNDITLSLEEFKKLYAERPIKDNHGGMKSPHLFNTWHAIRQLKPKLIIESGVWKGLGTWILHLAAPEAKIISIDIDYSKLEYRNESGVYLNQDITTFNWEKILKEDYPHIKKEEIVVFLDDHQNFLQRLEFIHELGIKHVLCEDNYPLLQGDILSPKKILACQDYIIDKGGRRSVHRFSYFDYEKFDNCVKIYQELPPIFKTKETRWGDEWEENRYPTKPPLLTEDRKKEYPVFYEEANSYTWICYMGLK
jgi:hypothetical protein